MINAEIAEVGKVNIVSAVFAVSALSVEYVGDCNASMARQYDRSLLGRVRGEPVRHHKRPAREVGGQRLFPIIALED
jgi:hypothetical protein